MSLIGCTDKASQKRILMFDPNSDCTTIDHSMPDWYTKPAILVEAITYNKIRRNELDFFNDRYAAQRVIAEQYALTKIGEHRKAWLEARIRNYNFMVRKETSLIRKTSFEEGRSFIKEVLEHEDGSIVEYPKCREGFFETRYNLFDFSLTTADPRHIWLVYFSKDKKVLLDKKSPKWYRKLASLSEKIAMAKNTTNSSKTATISARISTTQWSKL